MKKLLLSILFWEEDKRQAMQLARLLADLQDEHSDAADFLFVSRFDCTHDDTTVKYVSRKFDTHVTTSRHRGKGWPLGCNAIWIGMIEWLFHKKNAKQLPDYKAVFCIEADGAPLRKDWINYLSQEWDRVNETIPIVMAGDVLTNPQGYQHINGNALLSADLSFLKAVCHKAGFNARAGWDYHLAPWFKQKGWADLQGIKSDWRRPAFKEEEWEKELAEGTVWLHGVKDNSLIEVARKKLCP